MLNLNDSRYMMPPFMLINWDIYNNIAVSNQHKELIFGVISNILKKCFISNIQYFLQCLRRFKIFRLLRFYFSIESPPSDGILY